MLMYQTRPRGWGPFTETRWNPFADIDWDPFTEMRRIQSEMNRLFDASGITRGTAGYPPVNLWLGEASVVVTAELPGLSEDDIDLTVREDTLTIRGEQRPAVGDDEVTWHRRERRFGGFTRTIELPFRIDPDAVKARFLNGILEVEMERPAVDRPRRIAINSD